MPTNLIRFNLNGAIATIEPTHSSTFSGVLHHGVAHTIAGKWYCGWVPDWLTLKRVMFKLKDGDNPKDWSMTTEEFQKVIEHDGQKATLITTDVADHTDCDYGTLRFDDGFELEAVSSYHFT